MQNTKKSDLTRRINACFQRNDLRCVYKKEIDEDFTYRLGMAFVHFLKCKKLLVGHDMRISSPFLCNSLVEGIRDAGADVIHLGMIDTPALYFASGKFKLPGIMITASHNPKEYNGFKVVRSGAVPVGEGSGLNKLKKLICSVCNEKGKRGSLVSKSIIEDYKRFLFSFLESNNLEKLKVVVDAGNGMAAKMIPLVYQDFELELVPLYFKLDGNFPNHVPNPSILKTLKKLKYEVKKRKADLGIAFDGDMDRVVFVDDLGRVLNSSITATLLVKKILKKEKGNIVYSLVMSKLIKKIIMESGGNALREKVGHSYIKSRMKKSRALFGCEHSGHFYYKKNHYADSGFITSVIFLEIVSLLKKDKKRLSDVVDNISEGYSKSEEKNFIVKNKLETLKRIEKEYKKRRDFLKRDYLDGLTMDFKDWWFNLRPSGTENLLRLNVEANTSEGMRRELNGLIREVNRLR